MKLTNLMILLPLITLLNNPEITLAKTPNKPNHKPNINTTIKGNCGKYQCQSLFNQLTKLYPEYIKKYQQECTSKQILGLAISKEDPTKKVYFTCWDAKKQQDGTRYGSYLGALPTPGNESKFLTPLPQDSPNNKYNQYLQKNYSNELKKAQFKCATHGGNFNVLISEDQKNLQLQCYFQAGVQFIDSNNDWVSDGDTRGAGVDEILGTFPIKKDS